MPQTDPFSYNAPRKMSDTELARALRLDAAAELDAMNLYEAHIEATDNEDAKKLLRFIAKDEKEHYALFHELIRRLDPQQAAEMDGVGAKLDVILSTDTGLEAEETDIDAAGEAASSSGDGNGHDLGAVLEARDLLRRQTVGSLFGQRQQ
ncbi:MAG: demethoxyubiquinone hydroxylase family protein [Chloroflexi bacterium]|nr:demethoxyubiquinone hydroxylase family protein [Chloroflexota bacterium]